MELFQNQTFYDKIYEGNESNTNKGTFCFF